jgi:hypothetical protein
MKKSIFLALFVFLGLALNAQCTKTSAACCANKKAQTNSTTTTETKVASLSLVAEAEAAAEKNENIQKRVSEKDGTITYYEKSVCEHSGSVSWNQVEYNSSEKKFTRVASASVERNTIPADVKPTKACSAQDMKACSKEGKACCKNKKNS